MQPIHTAPLYRAFFNKKRGLFAAMPAYIVSGVDTQGMVAVRHKDGQIMQEDINNLYGTRRRAMLDAKSLNRMLVKRAKCGDFEHE